jgi:hypothetical protein
MIFTLRVQIGNAAMSTFDDLGRLLSNLGSLFNGYTYEDIESADVYDRSGSVKDDNGNRVGEWYIE